MKKKFVRLISAVLSAAMTLTAVPLSAFAEGEGHTHDGESNVITTPLDFREKKADENGVGWSWDYDTKTLTLNGVNIQATTEENMMSVVTVPDGTEIVLKGENTIIQTDTGKSDTYVLSAVNTNDVNCDGTMTISGDGVLNAENRSTDSMACSLGGSIILNGGTVNATGTVKTNSLEIHNDGVLNANATTASFEGVAVNVSRGITVDGNGSLTAVGCANESTLNSAILLTSNFSDKISVSENGSITVPEGNAARVGIYYSGNNGDGMDAEISGGKVTAYGAKYGIYKVNLIMSGTGSVYTTGGSYAIGQTLPAIDEDEFVVKGSTESKASESAVTADAKYNSGYYEIGGADAKTVVIKPDTEPSIKLGKQIGAVYADENGNASTAYFYITAKNFADGAFSPEAEWVTSPGSANIDAHITKTGGEYVCEVICDEPDFSRQYELRVKSGEVYSNTVTVTVGKPHFALTSRDSQSKYYTNYNGEQKITLRYDVEAGYENQDGLQYNWSSDSKKYDIADLGTVTTVDGVETLVFSDNVPEGSYVIYCDVVYNNDNGEAYTLTERFAFTFEECKHTGGFTDEVCNICHNACDHKNIDTDTGICVCGRQFVATISTDGNAPTGYGTLKDCLNSITADTGNYVKIYQDIEKDSSQKYIVKYHVTLDLNGHRLDDKLEINEKNSEDNNGELTLTGTGYIDNVYAYSNTTFTIDDNANIEADTFFNNAGTRFTVSDGANVTVRYLAVKESISSEGNATSVKLATGMKITEMLAYDRDISSPLSENIMLKNLLSDNQMLKYESSSKIIDLYYGASRIIINSELYGYGTITVVEHTDADHKYSSGTGKCEECGKPCEHGGDINTDNGICSVCGAVVSVAIYTDANGISKYVDTDELHSLLNEYGKSGTVKLFKDYYKIEQHDIDGVITIDLNGHDFTVRGVTPWSGGKVTFKNSGSEQVTCSGSVSPTVDAPGGTLIVDGDIYFDSAININDYGTVILNAGKYVDLTIKGDRTLCDMLGEGKAFFDANGNVFNASVQAGSDLTVKDHSHTYVDGKCGCGYVCPHSDVNIDTGKCTECEYQYAAVIVKDGAVASVYKETDMEAAFKAADSDANTGCTLRVYKNYTGSYTTLSRKFTLWIAKEANVGTLTVSGDITVTGSEKNNSIYGDFNVAAGGKLTFDKNCGAMGTVSVGAGTFDCYYSLYTTLNINDASSNVILHGGYFIKIRYNGGGDRANAEILTLLAENRMFMTRSNEPIDGSKTLLKDGFATTVLVIPHEDHGYDSTTGKCKICGKRCGHTDVDSKTGVCKTCQHEFVATLTVGDKVTGFDSLSDCLSKTSEDSENYVKIYKNIDDRTTINVNHTVTVDLNGHKLYYIELEVNNDNGAGNLTLTGSEGSYISQVDVCGGRTFKIDSDANINFETIFVEAGARFEVSYGANVTVNTLVVKESLTLYGSTTTSVRLTTGMRIGTLTYDLDRNSGSGNLLLYSLLGEGKALQYDNSGEYVDIYEKFTSKIIRDSFTVVYHYEHSYDKATGKCVCGYVCPHSDVDSKTGVCSVCEYQLTAGISGVGTAKYFGNIDDAFAAATSEENNGCTLTLYQDCELSQNAEIGNATVTVDINGHSISLRYRIKVNDGGVLYLKNSGENGSIETEIDVNKGGTLINGTADDSRSAVSVFGVTADAAKRVEIYGGSYEGLTVNNGTSGIALYGGSYELINTNDLTDSTPVSALLAKGYAFATLNDVTNLPEKIVDGSAVTLSEGIRNVTVVKHTDADHKYSSGTGKCDCGYVCPHSDVDSKTGVCSTCKYQLTAGISSAGTAKYFDNIDDAFTAALSAENNGCTLTLYKDCELSQNIVIGNATLTVDVNGHFISPEIRGIDVNDGGVLYLKNSGENGSIGLEMTVNKGGTLINGTADDSSSAVSLFAVTADAAECVEFYGGSCTYLTIKNGTSGIALYGGYYDIICGPLTDNTPVNDLLAKGYAFATLNSVTHLPESIVDGSAKTIGDGLKNVTVVAHEHRYNVETGKCPCGVCALAIFTETTQSSETYTFIESETQFKNIAENEADGVLKLTGDVDCIVKGIIINGNKTIDMNGHTLNVSVGTEETSAVAVYGNVTFENSGSSRAVINATCVYSYGMVTVNGDIEFDTFATFEDGDALINAGVFKNIYVQGRSVIEILGSGKALASESGEILNASVQQIYKAGDNIFVTAHPKHTYDDHGNCACGYKCLHDGEGQVDEDSANKVCSECGAKIYAKVTTADGKVKYFDDITEGLRYADKAENKGCVFTLVTTGGLENDITLSSGQFTITAIDDNYINAYTRKINIKGAEITVENCAFNCFVGLYSGSLTYPEGSTSVCINGISVFGGTLNISDGVSENFGANKFTISDTATDAKVTIGGGIYSEIKLGQYTFKDILASGTRLISVEYSQETDEIIATNELLYSIVSEQNTLGVDDDKDYRFVKCDHKNEDGSYAFNEGGICKYCNSEFAASVSYTDGGEKTELFGDIYDAFDKANEIGTATVTLQKNITDDITDTIAVTGNVTLELNGKRLSQPGTDVWYSIEVTSGKLTVNGSGLIKRVAVCNGSNAEINGGTFSDFIIKDGGNAVIKGGQFYSLQVSGEGRNVGQLLADGYAYWSLNKTGYWSTIAEREKQDIANVEVKEAPIKSASIAWVGEEAPVIYRNGEKYLYVDITYELAVGSRGATYSDFVNGNNRIKDYNLYNKYMVHCYEIGKLAAKDGEVEYYIVLKCNGYEYKSNVLKLTLATCSHPEDSFSYENDGFVICGICDALIEAEVVDADGKSLGYADIESAIKLAQENEGSTVKLMSEGVSESITVTGGRFTVDFNGKKVFYQFDVNGGDVTFTSSVKQADVETLISGITVNGTDAKVTIDGKIKLGSVTLTSGTLAVNSTDGYIKELSINGGTTVINGANIDALSINGGATVINGANIDALKTYGGDTVINDVNADSLTMCDNRSGGSKYNISIVSGRFGSFTCENGSNYTLGRAIASGSVVSADSMNGITVYTYEAIQTMTSTYRIFVDKCNHKDKNGSYVLDGNPCPYCNEEIVATVSYTAGGSEETDLFSDIYDAFDKANEIGTATVTLQKNITDDITDTIAVTGNVTLELNGKRLSQPGTDVWYSIEVTSGKLTVNGSGLIKRVAVCNGSNAEINGGTFSDFIIKDGGNAVIKGGQFYSLQVSGEGRNVGQLLADGYAYWSLNKTGYWSTIAEREKQDIANVEVKEAPIKSATITAEDESPIIYRNGKKASTFAADVTYSGNETLYVTIRLIDGTVIREKTELLNGYCSLFSSEVDKAVAEDGEIQYYCIFTYDGYDYKSNAVTLTVATCRHPVESVKCDDNGCVCGICDSMLLASVELSDGTLSYYNNWNDAIGAAEESEGCTLKLLSYDWVKFGEIFDISKGRFTVDLNKNDGNTAFAFDVKGGDITFTALQEASSAFTGVTVSGENANVLFDSKATLNSLVVNSGKVSADGANIGAITINGGDTVINDVNADYLSMKADTTGGSGYNVSIVSGTFNIFTCENESNYTLGRAIASGSRVIGLNAIVGSGFKYAEIQSMTKANYLNVIKCDHKDENDSYALDGNLCPYCNEEIAATVSYTADGSEQTDLFSDIYDAFERANERGTATVTLYKDIENSELTQGVTITGNVTLALNGKKLGGTFAFNAPVEVSDGGMFTVGGDGKMRMPIKAYANSKLIINGGEFTSVMVYIDGDAEIGGGVIDALTIIGNAKAKISGGKFYNIEIANGSLESVLADGYAYKKDGGAWLSIAERAESVYSSVNNDNKPVNVEEAPIKSATLSTEINQLYRNSNANPTLKFNLALAHGSNLNDSYVSKRYGINSYVSGDIIYSSLSALVKDAKLSADEIIDKAGNSVAAKIYFVVITDDGYEIKSNTVSIDLVDCDHSQVVDPTADKETAGNITEPTYCEICESKFNAKITKGDDVKYYNDLDEAAKDAQKSENEGCTLYPLYNKNGYGGQLVITEGNFTLKYAVRTAFSRPIIINGKAKLTVTGRCAVTAFENQDAFIVQGGDVTFDGLATGSNVTINGGNVTMAANNINCLTINGGNVSISSGGFAEIVTTVSDKVIADYIDPGFWVQDRGTKEWIDIYSLNKATASSTSGLTVRVCPMQIIQPRNNVYYTNGYYPGDIPSLQISAVPWYSGEVDAKVAYQWIGIDENGNETEIEGATDRKLSLENLTTGRYYCRITYSNATTAGVSMKSDVVTATITECEHSGGEATCTNKAKCEICGAEYGETKPHSYAQIKSPEYLKSAATCTAKAVYYTSCTNCGLSSKGTKNEATFEYGNALGHKYGEWVSNGDGTHTRVCANDSTHTETKACHGGKATCTAKAICEDCGKAYGEMAAHTFTAKTAAAKYLKSAATCTAKAVYYTSCADCGLSSKGTKNEATFEYGNALGHKYGKWVSNGNGTHSRVCANDNKHIETKACHGGKATCTAKAICEDCGKAYGTMAAHTFTVKSTVSRYLKRAATCTEKSEYYVSCAGCGLSSKGTASEAVFTGSALGHSLTEWSVITEVTCTTNGTQERHCTRCDYKQTRSIVAKGHSYGLWNVTKKVGCITDGEQSRECSVCGNKETKTIAATGVHSYGSWKVAKAATCTTTGTKVRSCSECGAKETVIIQPTGHKYVESTVKPTYTEKGYTLHKCSECGTSYKSSYTDKLVLASVSGVKLAGRAADALRVSWNRNTSADGYIVEIYKDGAWTRAGKITTDSTTDFKVTGLKASTFYKFRVRAYKMSGNTAVYSDYGTTLTARTNPSVIKGAKLAGRAADALRISWDRNTSADGYIVEIYKDGAWSRAGKITTDSTTDFRVTGLKASTVYKLRVRAYKMSGTAAYYGNYSAEVTARTNPSVIKGAKLAGRAADALRISWERNTSADGYIVEIYKDGAWSRAGKITTDSTTDFRVTGLKASTVYKLRVRAYKMSGTAAYYGNYSAEVTARTNPSVMTGVKIGGTAKDALRINWSKNTSAQGYIVEMAQNGKWVRVAKITDNSTTTFRKAGLAKNTSYRFRVCAYHMSGSTPLYGTYVSVSGKTAAN